MQITDTELTTFKSKSSYLLKLKWASSHSAVQRKVVRIKRVEVHVTPKGIMDSFQVTVPRI